MKLSNLFSLMEGREDVLFAKYEQKIEQQLAHNGEKIETRRAFDQLFRAVGPKVADWAIRQYLKGQFRIEDASHVNDDVMQYQKLSRQLPVEERDINKFDYRYIVNKLDELNKPEINTDAPDEDGVKVLYKGPYGFLCEILTKEASIRLGKGTRWCTAAQKNNQFDEYHTKGPLFFFQNTRGYKFQFHFEAKQFMDRRNEPIEVQELNRMVQSIPVIKKLFIVRFTELVQRVRDPIPLDWDDLSSGDPLADVVQRALDAESTCLHVLQLQQLKTAYPFIRVDNVRTHEYLHDEDEFIVKLFKMSKHRQYGVLKDLERDDNLRKRVINGLTFNPNGKATHLDEIKQSESYRFYQNILKIQSPSFLRDVTSHMKTVDQPTDVRTYVSGMLYEALTDNSNDGVQLTSTELEYGFDLMNALERMAVVKQLAGSLTFNGSVKMGMLTDNTKTLLLNACDPTLKPVLVERLNGVQLDRQAFSFLLNDAEDGKLPSVGIVSAYHILQTRHVLTRVVAERYVKKLQAATEQQIEMLYPTLVVETLNAINKMVLNRESELPFYATVLNEHKAERVGRSLTTNMADITQDSLYGFLGPMKRKEMTAHRIVDQLTSLYRQHGLAWYIKTDVWKRFVTDLTNGGMRNNHETIESIPVDGGA